MACRRQGDKPLSEPMMVRLPTHICVTRPQWVFNKTEQTWLWMLAIHLFFIANICPWPLTTSILTVRNETNTLCTHYVFQCIYGKIQFANIGINWYKRKVILSYHYNALNAYLMFQKNMSLLLKIHLLVSKGRQLICDIFTIIYLLDPN